LVQMSFFGISMVIIGFIGLAQALAL